MNYKDDVLEMLVFELRKEFKGSCAIVLTTENGMYSEFYSTKEIVDFIKFRVKEYFPEFYYTDSLRNSNYLDYPSDVRNNLDKHMSNFIGFSCNKELIDYLKMRLPYRADFVVFSATKSSSERAYLPPDKDAFVYDNSNNYFIVGSKEKVKLKMYPKDVVEFMNGISAIKGNIWNPCDSVTKNTADDLRVRLIEENYKRLNGPVDCEVWGVFNEDFENLLMLEIIYPYTGSRHINVALDLSKF